MSEPERLLSVTDVAEMLGVPVGTLYDWRSQRKGPLAIKIGRHLRYRRSDIDAWLDRQAAADG